jgi:hypothetical protein
MSWYRAPLWDLRPDITSSPNVAVQNLRSCSCGAPSLTRGRVCRSRITLRLTVRQYVLASSTLVGLATRYYFLSECSCPKFAVLFLWGALSDERMGETPPTWRARLPYLYSYTPGTGWLSCTPRHWVPFPSPLTTRRASVVVL